MSKYLILGGCGFIGRAVVDLIKKEELATKIRVADKKPACMSNMSQAQEEMYDDESFIDFIQAELTRDSSVQNVFSGQKFDYVINCAGENELGLDEAVYQERVINVTEKCAKAAAAMGAKFIQISDARVYKQSSKPVNEEGTIKPWTKLADAHYKAEQILKGISGLNYVILRPAVIYGPGDRSSTIMNRLVIGAIYQYTKKTMLVPFTGKIIISTVHVRDVAQAIIAACQAKSGSIYNVSDSGYITSGEINKLLESIYQIKTDFASGVQNLYIKSKKNDASDIINDEHMQPWNEMCKKCGATNSILSPFMSPEILTDDDFCIDGTKICGLADFQYRHQKPNAGLLLESINYFRKTDPPQFPK